MNASEVKLGLVVLYSTGTLYKITSNLKNNNKQVTVEKLRFRSGKGGAKSFDTWLNKIEPFWIQENDSVEVHEDNRIMVGKVNKIYTDSIDDKNGNTKFITMIDIHLKDGKLLMFNSDEAAEKIVLI